MIRQVRGTDIIDIAYLAPAPGLENNQATEKAILNDRNGNVTEYFYDVGYRMVRMREFTGRASKTGPTTDTVNRPTGKLRPTDPDYFQTTYEYNSDHLPTRTIHSNGNITERIYESDHNPKAPPRTRGNLRLLRQLPGTHQPAGDQLVIQEQFQYDTDFGCTPCGFKFVTKYTDPRGNVILSQFDERGNLLARTNRITSVVDRWEYNARGQMARHTRPDNGTGHRRVDEFRYYDAGPQRGYRSEEIMDFGGFNLTTRYEHDAVGNVIRLIDPRGHDSQYTINQLDQVVGETSREVVDGSGIRYMRDYFYDANNNLIRTEVQNRVALADGGGIVATNPTWTTTFDYDVLNFVTRKTFEISPGHDDVRVR